MINLLLEGQISLFILIILALIISLSFHEFGHAAVAKLYGDDTAQRAGRLTINPIAHIDPLGLLMVVFVGFGYAKPVPTNPRNFRSRWASPLVAFAGPAMNLLLAIVVINTYALAVTSGITSLEEPGQRFFFVFLAKINLLLMIFNLIPLGALDGHYILPYLLPRNLATRYVYFNDRYGNQILLGLILLAVLGLPIFRYLLAFSDSLLPLIIFV